MGRACLLVGGACLWVGLACGWGLPVGLAGGADAWLSGLLGRLPTFRHFLRVGLKRARKIHPC